MGAPHLSGLRVVASGSEEWGKEEEVDIRFGAIARPAFDLI